MRAQLVAGFMLLASATSHADSRGTLRVGVLPLDLESSSDTPLFGEHVDRAVSNYNTAAAARGMSSRIDAADLGIAETLYSIAPGVEVGAGHYLFRLEGVLGLGADLKSFGIGIYPLGLQGRVGRSVVVYVSAGGTASWLDRSGSGDVGGLVGVRGAVGARIVERFVVEIGYNAFILGGTVNRQKLDDMMATGDTSDVDGAISAGEARGLVDLSVGLSF